MNVKIVQLVKGALQIKEMTIEHETPVMLRVQEMMYVLLQTSFVH